MTATEARFTRRRYVGVSQGMCGWTATLFDVDGPETHWGVYHTDREDAISDAQDWADADGLELDEEL